MPPRQRALRVVGPLVLLLAVVASSSPAPDDAPRAPATSRATTVPGAWIVLLSGDKPPVVAESTVSKAFKVAHPRWRLEARQMAGVADPLAAATARESAAGQVEAYSEALKQEHLKIFEAALGTGGAGAGAASLVSGAAAGAAGGPSITYHYTVTLNGFAVQGVSAAQAAALRSQAGVRAVVPARRLYPQTVSTPTFLGLAGAGGVWEKQFGGASNNVAGDVLIGVIDTGILPGAASFAGDGTNTGTWPGLGPGTGACSEANTCTAGKLVACRFYEKGIEAAVSDGSYVRPANDKSTCIDVDGHGTHTAGTAGGNLGAAAFLAGGSLGADGMSGVAPGAAVAMYKALWTVIEVATGEEGGFGTDTDIVAAIQQAVKDGVDVINFSAGGSPMATIVDDPVFEAFRGAAAAGVFIAASAGNAGPDLASLSNEPPWMLTVAAGTHSRKISSSVQVDGVGTLTGAGIWGSNVGPAPLYMPPSTNQSQSLCFKGALDASKAAGKIVVCLRGTNARVDKSAEVARVGGIGMLLLNVASGATDLVADTHSVPTVHLNAIDGAKVIAATQSGTPSATILARTVTYDNEAPSVASFSSRGPALADGAWVLKPDINGPGVNVFAATKVPTNSSDTGALLSGTSMSSPHLAGLAALIVAKNPDWSPAAVKSALMTTASQITNKGNPIEANPFDMGAGEVNITAAFTPGLIYDAGEIDYQRYVCSLVASKNRPDNCTTACRGNKCKAPAALRNLNLPSFSLSSFGSGRNRSVTVKRTVTYVGEGKAEFTSTLQLPTGYSGRVKKKLTFNGPGTTRTFKLTVKVDSGAAVGWDFGSLTWTSGQYTVRSPIAVQKLASTSKAGG